MRSERIPTVVAIAEGIDADILRVLVDGPLTVAEIHARLNETSDDGPVRGTVHKYVNRLRWPRYGNPWVTVAGKARGAAVYVLTEDGRQALA